MVDELTPTSLPASVRDIVLARGGQSILVGSSFGTLIDQGVLERRNGDWTVRDLPNDSSFPTRGRVCSRRASTAGATGKGGPPRRPRDRRNVLGWSRRRALGRRDGTSRLEERDFIRPRPSSSIVGEQNLRSARAHPRCGYGASSSRSGPPACSVRRMARADRGRS